jgi:hypothetical protein
MKARSSAARTAASLSGVSLRIAQAACQDLAARAIGPMPITVSGGSFWSCRHDLFRDGRACTTVSSVHPGRVAAWTDV